MYTVYIIDEKVNFQGFKTLNEAHAHCVEYAYPIMLIFEGMTMDDIFYNKMTKALALYVNGKQYDVSESK